MADVTAELHIPDSAWEDTSADGPAGSRLSAQCRINRHAFHVEAYRVAEVSDVQDISDEYWRDEWEALCTFNQNSAFQTMRIRDAEYVIVITPHGT